MLLFLGIYFAHRVNLLAKLLRDRLRCGDIQVKRLSHRYPTPETHCGNLNHIICKRISACSFGIEHYYVGVFVCVDELKYIRRPIIAHQIRG